jgi:excisionase family DNA binding protein
LPEFMTLSEVADYLRVTRKTVYRLLGKRKIPATLVGSRWRFERSAIEDWLRSRSTEIRAEILVVDDDEAVRTLFKDTLESVNHGVVGAQSAADAVELVKERQFDLAFVDLKMPGTDGAELLRQIKALRPDLPVTIITGYPDSDLMARALEHGPLGVMAKPFSASEIMTAVNNYIRFGLTASRVQRETK